MEGNTDEASVDSRGRKRSYKHANDENDNDEPMTRKSDYKMLKGLTSISGTGSAGSSNKKKKTNRKY